MRQSHRLIHNALVGWAARFVEVIISFVLLPFVVHRLGDAGYGVFALVLSVSMVLDILRMALGVALTRYVADYAAQGREDLVNSVLGTMFVAGIVFGLVGAAMMVTLGDRLADSMGINPAYRHDFDVSLKLMAMLVVASFALTPYMGVLLGYQRHDALRICQTVLQVVRAGLTVGWFLLVGPSVIALAVITLAHGVLLHLSWLGVSHRFWPWLSGSPRQFRLATLKVLLGFSAIMILIQLNTALVGQARTWIVGGMISVDFVTYLSVMVAPAGFLLQLINDLTLTIMPAASKYQAANDRQVLVELLIRGTRYSFLASGACLAVLVPIMRPFLRVWMGPGYEHLAPYMTLITLCAGVGVSELCAHNMLKGLGRIIPVLVRGIVGGGACLLVTVVGIKGFHQTYWAVAAGAGTGYIVSLVLHNWMCMTAIGAPPGRFLWRAYGQPLIVLCPILAAAWLVTEQGGLRSALALGLVGAGAAGVFCLGFAVLFFTADEWRLGREFGQQVWRRMLPARATT